MNERTTISLPTELVRLAERKAAEQGRTLTDVIDETVRLAFTEKKPKPHGPIPVSTATGGFNPGFETDTFRKIEELEDAEYIERLKNGFK